MRTPEILLVLLTAASTSALGCAKQGELSSRTLNQVADELGRAGLEILYPAQTGVEPGQVYISSGDRPLSQAWSPRPGALSTRSGRASFIELSNDSRYEFRAASSSRILGEEISVALDQNRITEFGLSFGAPTLVTFYGTDLLTLTLTNPELRSQIEHFLDSPDLVMIGSTLQTSSIAVSLKSQDASKAQAVLPKLAEVFDSELNVTKSGEAQAQWEISDGRSMTIAYRLFPKETLRRSRSLVRGPEDAIDVVGGLPD